MAAGLCGGYDLKLVRPECLPGAEHFRADVLLRGDIAEALPYLNAALEGGDYSHEAKVLLWNSGGKRYAFRPGVISIAPAADREEADSLARAILQRVEGIWARRCDLRPRFEGRRPPPGLLEIYKTLPRTNCRACGFASCMAFAGALRGDPSLAARCPAMPPLPAWDGGTPEPRGG